MNLRFPKKTSGAGVLKGRKEAKGKTGRGKGRKLWGKESYARHRKGKTRRYNQNKAGKQKRTRDLCFG